ncbi:hypothetical protein DV738_g839, partial [Chaetothyriales sp. CBS 135597]
MLRFFSVSYHSWASAQTAHPDECLNFALWLRDTRLFEQAWWTAVATPARFWWTQQIFFFTTGWSVFVGREGNRRAIPHLWAYMLLGQIVAISFATNLFFLAALLSPLQQHQKKKKRANASTNPSSSTGKILSLLVHHVGPIASTLISVGLIPYFYASTRTWRVDQGQESRRTVQHVNAAPALSNKRRGTTHFACESCKAKKLKCSGEIDGCSRCRQNNAICTYSSEPDGRRRKRNGRLPRTASSSITRRTSRVEQEATAAEGQQSAYTTEVSNARNATVADRPGLFMDFDFQTPVGSKAVPEDKLSTQSSQSGDDGLESNSPGAVMDWSCSLPSGGSTDGLDALATWADMLDGGEFDNRDLDPAQISVAPDPSFHEAESLDTLLANDVASRDRAHSLEGAVELLSPPTSTREVQVQVVLQPKGGNAAHLDIEATVTSPDRRAKGDRCRCLTILATGLSRLSTYTAGTIQSTTDNLINAVKCASNCLADIHDCSAQCLSRSEIMILAAMAVQHMFTLYEQMVDRQRRGSGPEGLEIHFGRVPVTVQDERNAAEIESHLHV